MSSCIEMYTLVVTRVYLNIQDVRERCPDKMAMTWGDSTRWTFHAGSMTGESKLIKIIHFIGDLSSVNFISTVHFPNYEGNRKRGDDNSL